MLDPMGIFKRNEPPECIPRKACMTVERTREVNEPVIGIAEDETSCPRSACEGPGIL